jgi:rubredoxin-NAD+ reductase
MVCKIPQRLCSFVRKSQKNPGTGGIFMSTKGKPKNKLMEVNIMKYICDVCGWEYDESQGYPEGGIAPGTKWEDIPEDFECPLCMVGKDQFSEE